MQLFFCHSKNRRMHDSKHSYMTMLIGQVKERFVPEQVIVMLSPFPPPMLLAASVKMAMKTGTHTSTSLSSADSCNVVALPSLVPESRTISARATSSIGLETR